ncbi:host-nuclease inhibitor Gam family protein [Escherichia coli]|nr:host-nuclease inhibitor Gam family protein [Escherichia coli]MBB0286693.1 host-nuclease inhibitor protein Gam [Escherichia coli]
MLPSETMIWQPEFTDKTLSRKPGAVQKEAELADDMEKGLPQHLFESLCIDHLQRHGASKKAITRAFDDDVEFQERMAEHIRYIVETIAHHQADIDSEV